MRGSELKRYKIGWRLRASLAIEDGLSRAFEENKLRFVGPIQTYRVTEKK